MTTVNNIKGYSPNIGLMRRKLNKRRKNMKSFKKIASELSESPVGKVGRTKDNEADEHIENTDVAKRFKKIVRELGGKTVAKKLLSQMASTTKQVSEGNLSKSPALFLRDNGFKIKDEEYKKHSFELEFYKDSDAKEAYKELKSAGFMEMYSMNMAGSFIGFENL